MRPLKFQTLAVLGCVGLLLLAACSRSDNPGRADASATPSPAPTATAATAKSADAATRLVARLVNLGADKCIPCKQMVPVRTALAAEYPDTLAVSFIDVWVEREAGAQHKVRVIPTQIIQDAEGRELFRHEGYWPKEAILRKFAELGLELGQSPGNPGA